MIRSCLDKPTTESFMNSMKWGMANLNDGHGAFWHTFHDVSYAPLLLNWIEGKFIITNANAENQSN